MKLSLILVITLWTSLCLAQKAFEPGYFIDNEDVKTECLIRNLDWKNNPKSISYQLPGSTEIVTLAEDQIKEFGILGFSKFQRFTVAVDTSSSDLSRLSKNSTPQFKEETTLLKVLVDGPLSLYYYAEGDGTRFFFKTDTGTIEQLVYKQYMIDGKVGMSYYFRSQLRHLLKCAGMAPIHYDQLKYSKSALMKAFEKYYRCRRGKYTNYDESGTQESFHLTFRPGISISSLSVQSENNPLRDTRFSSELSCRVGLEAEYVFPFRKNHWSLFLEPSYQFYQTDKQTALGYSTVDFATIDLSFGPRYAFRPQDQSTIFLNGSVTFSGTFDSHSTLTYENDINKFTFRAATRFSAGIGYDYHRKVSIEVRYHLRQNILIDYLGFDSQYKTISLIAGYSFF